MAAAKATGGFPAFTGRNVPLAEIAKATGRSAQFLAKGLREGIFCFCYAAFRRYSTGDKPSKRSLMRFSLYHLM